MKIIDILKKESTKSSDAVKIELKLYNLADDLEKKARVHLKRIMQVLPEFDIHDEKHSEKVIENIERLLGNKVLKTLSVYELFLLHISAFFHDCAMAPSDWEINTMKLTEGNERFADADISIRHDLKPKMKFSQAKATIVKYKNETYKKYEKGVESWLFSPKDEEALIDYLALLLIEYQDYRNGFAAQLKNVKTKAEFVELNKFIRMDYIRATHHTRIEKYVRNIEPVLSNAFEQAAWGRKLAHDLSLICRSHGEDINFIERELKKDVQYYGDQSTNLQMVAVMLRLGDIIHFSFDRAPVDIRNAKLFKSSYSFLQWAIKDNGVNYSITNGTIAFRAYCETPETYFSLHEYLDWIEVEIQNYFKLQRQWRIKYIANMQDKIERSNISNDEEAFFPKRGLSFTLNQKKIIELLMGIGLYKEKFACLRELYQNALDAVRCMLSAGKDKGYLSAGRIEFDIEQRDDDKYLSCLDNGIGMTREIIEGFLLRIGNSFYKSGEFYRQQAQWNNEFTPTSQFGIGILSCFMIGTKIEITTKTAEGDYLSFVISGPHENFYYKKATDADRELLPISGTLVKVLLNEQSATQINNERIIKIGLFLLDYHSILSRDEKLQHVTLSKQWEESLYLKVDDFIKVPARNVQVFVGATDGSKSEILGKPVILNPDNPALKISKEDYPLMDHLISRNSFFKSIPYVEALEALVVYPIRVETKGGEYLSTLTLPRMLISNYSLSILESLPISRAGGICIDGIATDRNSLGTSETEYSISLSYTGILNFFGELRPQLSVDRKSIVNYPGECEGLAKELTKLLIQNIIDITRKHASQFGEKPDGEFISMLWDISFKKMEFASFLFIDELANTHYADLPWKRLNDKLEKSVSIKEFLQAPEILIKNLRLLKCDTLTKNTLLAKLISAERVEYKDGGIFIKQERLTKIDWLNKREFRYDNYLFVRTDTWDVFNAEFDIIQDLYPLVPARLFELMEHYNVESRGKNVKSVHRWSNGMAAFIQQSPTFIHDKMGLYSNEGRSSDDNKIYNFENKRSEIPLFELNERFDNLEKSKYVLMVYINPADLNSEKVKELEKYRTLDPSYFQGVNEGWSLLATSMQKENIAIIPGKATRQQLVAQLSDDFWETYKDYTFKFTDGTIMTKSA